MNRFNLWMMVWADLRSLLTLSPIITATLWAFLVCDLFPSDEDW
jgi:hypothetical protein